MTAPASVSPAGPATLRVAAKSAITSRVVSVTLVQPEGARLPDWTPGAHIDIVPAGGQTRQYSLCGDRWDAYSYRIAVLREADGRGGSAYIHDELAVGHIVGFGGPRNNFTLVPSPRYLFVAGGIGITPLLPMIRQTEMVGADWTLVHVGRSRDELAFADEVTQYGDRVSLHASQDFGRLDVHRLLAQPRADTAVYCCGPASLIAAVESACAAWPPYSLHVERFTAGELVGAARTAPFEVQLARTGRSVTVDPHISVLDAVAAAGVNVLSSCRQGLCGTCETGVIGGRPDHRDAILSDAEREEGDVMFVCVSRSCSDRLVLDL